jgi:hypothetical protein
MTSWIATRQVSVAQSGARSGRDEGHAAAQLELAAIVHRLLAWTGTRPVAAAAYEDEVRR